MCGILVLMLSAFIQLHRDQFALVVADQHHEAALDAARSGAEYCTFRIERERNWGRAPFSGADCQPEINQGLELDIQAKTRHLKGKVLKTGATFEVDILNNLKGTATDDGVPAGKCRLRVTGSRGLAKVRRELVLSIAPLFDAGVVSSMGINISANKLRVASKDPLRNRLRSKKEIVVPDYNGRLEFPSYAGNASRTLSNGTNNVERGLLWAKTGITTQTGQDLSDPDQAQKASATTGGRFIPKATTNYEIHDLRMQDLMVPDNNVTSPEGMYVFTEAPVTYTTLAGTSETRNVRMLQRRTGQVVNENGTYTGGNIEEYWYLKTDFPANGEPGWPQSTSGDSAVGHMINNDPGVTNTSFPIFAGITANLNLNSINIDPDLHVFVEGEFGVATEVADRTPVVQFKTESGLYKTGAITSTGNVLIEGFVYGSGKIAAKGDVTLRPNAAVLSSDEQTELSIFSEQNVRIRRPKTVTGSDGDFYFNGLIYAKNDVYFDGQRGTGTGRNVTIQGAVVARDGSVRVEGVNEATIIYDPAYLDSLVKELAGGQTRIERCLWKEF